MPFGHFCFVPFGRFCFVPFCAFWIFLFCAILCLLDVFKMSKRHKIILFVLQFFLVPFEVFKTSKRHKTILFRLLCHSGSNAASQDSLCCCYCCILAAKSTFTIGLLMQRLEIQDLGSKLNIVNRSVTQKGVAYFKSAATLFFNNF